MPYTIARAVVALIGCEFGALSPSEAIMALFGAVLMIGREAGVTDFELHQGFGAFLEDNAE